MSEEDARKYICEIIVALEFIHKQGFVYNTLKPSNILLTEKGHVKLSDFGFGKMKKIDYSDHRQDISFMTPEVLEGDITEKSCDWNVLGNLMYQMLVGKAPYYAKQDNKRMYHEIMSADLVTPGTVSFEARDLIKKLMRREQKKRLGYGPSGVSAIKQHMFFKGVNWDAVANGELEMPAIEYNNKFVFKSEAESQFTKF